MSSKSHRAKALAAQLEAGPSTTAGELVPPASLVKPKVKKTKSVKDGVVGKGKGKGKAVDVQEDEQDARKPLGQEEDEEEVAADGHRDVEMEQDGLIPTGQAGQEEDDDADMLIDSAPVVGSADASSSITAKASSATKTSSDFLPISQTAQNKTLLKPEERRVPVPAHRMAPLKKEWVNIYGPLVEIMGLMVRMNVHKRCVEMKTSKHTPDQGAIQKGADFVKAFALGFDVKDAIAILRLEDLYLDSFEIKDVKTLHGDHLSRAIGRIAGQDGKTKFTIENASRTRIVLADTHVHILGSVQNIKIARDAIVSLILGSPPGKVYAHLRSVGARLKQRF